MKNFINKVKDVALYIWQLPQNLLGLLLIAIYKPTRKHILDNGVEVHYAYKMTGGISLGKYALVHTIHYRQNIEESLKRDTVRHEALGHTKQSLWLGPLYLPIVGLQSICWAGLYGRLIAPSHNGYYKFWTEKWADKLAGVERN
jgi:hypothetical protein